MARGQFLPGKRDCPVELPYVGSLRPKSILGKALGVSFVSEGMVFAVAKSYFDGSGQENAKFFTLSGVAANDDVWADIETNWQRILHDRKPAAEYMHMVEAIPLRKGFSPDKGWDDTKVDALVSDFLIYLNTVDKTKYCHFVCTVDMNAYRKLQAETYQMDSAVDLCNTGCVKRVMAWFLSRYKGMNLGLDLTAAYYFDCGEPFEPVFKAEWEWETRIDEETGCHSIWSHIEQVSTRYMKKTPGIQVADMFAWASNREQNMPTQRYTHLGPAMRWLLPYKSFVWDEPNLRKRFRPLIYLP
jgi:hypothetical protein